MSLDTYTHEREQFFEEAFNKAFGRIEDYRFRGFNHALGRFVESKAHYKKLLKQKGLMPSDAAEEIVEEVQKNADRQRNKPLSDEAQSVIRAIRACPRRKDGTIELGGRLIEAMVRIKAIGNDSPYEPEGYRAEGGFN
jgi:hypothetical protein